MSDRIDIAGWEVREVCIGLTADLAIGPRDDPGRRAPRDPARSALRGVEPLGARRRLDLRAARALGALVQRREVAGVLLVDDVALDLQRRGELAGLLRQVVIQDEEALDLLDLRVLLVRAVEL